MTKTIEHVDPALPSLHLDHSKVFMQELENRPLGFDTGISALAAEMDGAQRDYEKAQAKLAAEHAEFIEGRVRLQRDLERAKRMVLAGQQAYSDDIPVGGE